jgi:hypothetical protein
MKNIKCFNIAVVVTMLFITNCTNNTPPKSSSTDTSNNSTSIYKQVSPMFNADSAYYFIKKQVEFGPRVTASKESIKCSKWIVNQFKKYDAEVIVQEGSVTNWDKRKINIINIIAQTNTKATKRILITAHWDSRPYADNDPIESNKNKPVLAADDGGSGIGVMLELARVIQKNKLDIGVDFICFDAEDLGKPEYEDSYCLGTQYWGKNQLPVNYKASYAINLDMVGGKGAKFVWEKNSIDQGEATLRKVWEKAALLGYSDIFQYLQLGQITDDHVYVHKYTQIPAIDLIHFNQQTGFPIWWHTVNDDMTNIDNNTLKSVGQTLLEVIYSEK